MIDTRLDIMEHQNNGLDLAKWQNLVNMLAELFDAASGDIIQFKGDHFNVVTTSENPNNFLSANAQWSWQTKTFCRYIVENHDSIYVNNAQQDDFWSDAPFVVSGEVCSYFGEPIYWPNGEVFGSFCVIDNKPTQYSDKLKLVLSQLKLLVEGELQHLVNLQRLEKALIAKEQSKVLAEEEYRKRLQTEVKLATKESIVSTTLETLVDAVLRITPEGKILAVNSATLDMFQYSGSQLIGHNIKLLMPEKYGDQHKLFLQSFLNKGTKKVFGDGKIIQAKRKDGNLFPVRISVSELNLNGDKQFIGLVEDITETIEYENKLKNQALHDTLTGCANRLLLEQSFTYQIENALRCDEKFTIAYIDLNNFKPINDNLGHKAGDFVLVETCQRLRENIRTTDLLARVGGDEFVIIFNKEVNQASMTNLLTSIIEQTVVFDNHKVEITASIGYATFPEDGACMDALMDKADHRMYQIKKQRTDTH